MAVQITSRMRLYDRQARRLYINGEERKRFLRTADQQPNHIRAFCYTLAYTGCRISEALELHSTSLQYETRIITFRTLKRRREDDLREVPAPPVLLSVLNTHLDRTEPAMGQLIWQSSGKPINRITAYRWVKQVMAQAGLSGPKASPKGLRHGYGVAGTLAGVQLHMLQKWMGHASMETTAIYATALGADELLVADRMWDADPRLAR